MQQRILPALHYSLKQDGLLMLGSAETVGNRMDLFAVVDNESKIYSKKLTPARLGMDFLPPKSFEGMIGDDAVKSAAAMPSLADVETRASRLLRDLYAPPGVIVNETLQILHFQGPTGFYLEQPTGEASLNLLRLARESLLCTLRKTVDRAIESNETVFEPAVRVRMTARRAKSTCASSPLPNPKFVTTWCCSSRPRRPKAAPVRVRGR